MAEDFYQTLGVSRTASQDEIKRAYRRLAHKYHPDKGGGDEEKFKQINAAYQVLSDKEKRGQYDQFGSTFDQGSSGQDAYQDFSGFSGFSDIFNDFLRQAQGTRAQQQVRRGDDVALDITLDFIESAKSITRDVAIRLYQSCDKCRGSGAEPNTPIISCERCGGRGQVTSSQQTIFGVFAQATICPDCHGVGKKPKQKCSQCNGQGRQRQSRTLQINIPAGISNGQIIRIAGKGEAPPFGGVSGDLYVTVHIRPHASMRRDHDNVHTHVPVSFVDAALGTTVSVATLEGKSDLKIPSGTQPGAKLTLHNKGFPHLRSAGRGDHVVTVDVEIPKRLSRKQRQLLEEYKEAKKNFLF